MDFLSGVGASLVAAAIAGILGYVLRSQQYQKSIEAAPERYVHHLGSLIQEALEGGKRNAIVNGKAIVAARNDLRDGLLSLASLFNSEIDELESLLNTDFELLIKKLPDDIAKQLQERKSKREKRVKLDEEEIFEIIQIISKKWRIKRDQIEYQIRKLISELGLDKI